MNLCGFEVGLNARFFLIAGPCVIESEALALATAADLKKLTGELGIPFIYKSSFDKANRSSQASFRGPGMEEGLRILGEVRRQLGLPAVPDGEPQRFDDTLEQAVIRFQRDHGLTPDGVVGPRTIIHMNSIANRPGVPRLAVDAG